MYSSSKKLYQFDGESRKAWKYAYAEFFMTLCEEWARVALQTVISHKRNYMEQLIAVRYLAIMIFLVSEYFWTNVCSSEMSQKTVQEKIMDNIVCKP